MGDTSFPSFCILSKGNINYMTKMKDMKIWRVVFVMLATLILVSCSSDDEDYQIDQLAGTWLQVYDEGVVAEGYVKYTFSPLGSPPQVAVAPFTYLTSLPVTRPSNAVMWYRMTTVVCLFSRNYTAEVRKRKNMTSKGFLPRE